MKTKYIATIEKMFPNVEIKLLKKLFGGLTPTAVAFVAFVKFPVSRWMGSSSPKISISKSDISTRVIRLKLDTETAAFLFTLLSSRFAFLLFIKKKRKKSLMKPSVELFVNIKTYARTMSFPHAN